MAQTTRVVGQVAAIIFSSTAPTNQKILWYDERVGIPADERIKYYNTDTSQWASITTPPPGSIVAIDRQAADISARDALLDKQDGENVYVVDASDDSEVTTGWAVYKWFSSGGTWQLQTKEETVTIDLSSKENTGVAQGLIDSLKSTVSTANDTLKKIEDNLALRALSTDPRFTDQRIPTNTSVTIAKLATETVNLIGGKENTGVAQGLIDALKSTVTSANDTLAKIETNINARALSTDPRFTDQRTPLPNSVVSSKIPNDEIDEAKLNPTTRAKLLSTTQIDKLTNVPSNTNAAIDAASKHSKGNLTGNLTITPTIHDFYYWFEEVGDVDLIFDENLSSAPKLPDALLIRTKAGSGTINLISDGANTLTVEFFDLANNAVSSLPGDGDYVYILLLRPGTEATYDIYGDQPTITRNIEFLSPAQAVGASLNNYNFTKGTSDNIFVHIAWAGGTPFTSVTFGGVAMFREAEVDTTFSTKLWQQVWRLKQADLPASGLVNIVATGGSGQTNVLIRVFRIKDSEQTTLGLLDVTGDGANTRIIFDEAANTTFNTISWPTFTGTAIYVDFALVNAAGANWTQTAHQTEFSDIVVGGAVSQVASWSKRNSVSTLMRQFHNIGSNQSISHLSFYLLQV